MGKMVLLKMERKKWRESKGRRKGSFSVFLPSSFLLPDRFKN